MGLLLLLECFVLAHYFEIDVISSLTYVGRDIRCPASDPTLSSIGVHCFGDYYQVVEFASEQNPWETGLSNYAASGMVIQGIFGAIGTWLGSPRTGLVLYLVAMAGALVTPAIWAGRGKPIATRIILAGAFGLVCLPALMALDRGNVVGFAVPGLLALLVAVVRGNSRAMVIAIVLIALIKPQFAILVLVPFALRMWRQGLIAAAGVFITNLLAYLAWPRDFPLTIWQSVMGVMGFTANSPLGVNYPANVSLAKSLRDLEYGFYWLAGNGTQVPWFERYGSIVGTGIVILLIVLLAVWGKRLPPLVSVVLLTSWAFLLPSVTYSYYLVFAIPVAAVLLRDPASEVSAQGFSGALDRPARSRSQKVAILLIVLATTASLTRIILPLHLGVVLEGYDRPLGILFTNAAITPSLWLVATIVALVAWKSAPQADVVRARSRIRSEITGS